MAIVNTSFNSIFATQYSSLERLISDSILKISSGLRLTNAGDGPADVIQQTYLNKQIKTYEVSRQNADDALSLLQTAYVALGQMSEILLEMQDLTLQSMNDVTVTDAERAVMNTAYLEHYNSLLEIAQGTEWNGLNLLDGTYVPGKTLMGPGSFTQTLELPNMVAPTMVQLGATSIDTVANATAAQPGIETMTNYVSYVRSLNGLQVATVEEGISFADDIAANYAAALSNVQDVDMASEIAHFASLQILSQSTSAIMAQANNSSARVISLLESLPN